MNRVVDVENRCLDTELEWGGEGDELGDLY